MVRAMMTIAGLSAGDGYGYYMSQTVSGDRAREAGRELGDYYLEGGTPPGRWMGAGCQQLGVDGEVTEAQMKNLFGLGWHPDAQQIIDADQASGMSADQAIKDAQLGRAYASYQTPSGALAQALDRAVGQAEARKGGRLDAGERRAARMKEAGVWYRKVHGESAPNGEALARWMAGELHKGRNPKAGFDLTCSAPKSVSVLWAGADDQTRAKIEQVHAQAVADTLAWVEEHALLGRVGAGGVRKVRLEGAVATVFRHWTSRDGDPDLHDHIVVSNKGRRADLGPDAKPTDGWVSIDSRWLYKHIQTASAVYDQQLSEGMRGLGYAMENRPQPGSKKQHIEVEGITDKTIEEFSGRSQDIRARTVELVHEFEDSQGRTPDKWETKKLAQQANLETRKPKDQPLLLADLVRETQQRLTQKLPRPRAVPARSEQVSVARVAAGIVAELAGERASWSEHHMDTKIAMWAGQHAGVTPKVQQQVKQAVLANSVALGGGDSAPEAIADLGVTRQYTSRVVLEQERVVLDAAAAQVVPSVMPEAFTTARDAYAAELAHDGKRLDEGQEAVARDFACSDHIVSAGIGPAGAGKTTAMKLVVEAGREAGVNVIGLSTTASAAKLLGEESGARAETLTMWNYRRGRGANSGAYQLRAGDIIIVDEASMASTEALAAVVADARNAGAFVRLMGDPNQLSSVTAGGLLRELDRRDGAVRLETLYRFRDAAEGLAGVQLATAGNLDWYCSHDRVHGVAPSRLAETVMSRWAAARATGTPMLVMAKSNAMVDRLAAAGQRILIERGDVDHTVTVALAAHDQVAGVGDQIITRKVDRRNRYGHHDFVKNGDRWTVQSVGDDGSATVANAAGQTVTLTADYLGEFTQLAYAQTTATAQGRTVTGGSGIVVAEDSMGVNDLYVGLTRGSDRNDVYVALDGRSPETILDQIASRSVTRQTAHEMAEVAAAQTDDPARYIPIMRSVTGEADRARFDIRIRDAYTALYGPGHEAEAALAADSLIGAESRRALDNALRRGEAAGFSVGRLLAATAPRQVTDADDAARLVAWRIDRHLARAERETPATDRPLAGLSEDALSRLAARTVADRDAAREALSQANRRAWFSPRPAEMRNGEVAPSWADRPHGLLTDRQLAAATDVALAGITDATQQWRQARGDLAAAEADWHASYQAGHREDPLAAAAALRVGAGRQQVARAADIGRQAREELAGLRAEKQIRRRMTGRSWKIEQVQREDAARRQNPDRPQDSRYVDRREAVDERFRAGTGQERALDRWRAATVIASQVAAEQALRLRQPDQEPPDRMGLPTWAGASGALTDPHTPAHTRDQLREAATWLGYQIQRVGAEIAADPGREPWIRELGPMPTEPGPQRDRWIETAGKVDTYRRLARVEDPERALPIPESPRQAVEVHTLRAAMSDIRAGQPALTIDQARADNTYAGPRDSRQAALAAQGRTRPESRPAEPADPGHRTGPPDRPGQDRLGPAAHTRREPAREADRRPAGRPPMGRDRGYDAPER